MDISHHPELVHPTAYVASNATILGKVHVVAGALVPAGMVIPPHHLVLGVPARIVRELADEEIEHAHSFATRYVERTQAFLAMNSGY